MGNPMRTLNYNSIKASERRISSTLKTLISFKLLWDLVCNCVIFPDIFGELVLGKMFYSYLTCFRLF